MGDDAIISGLLQLLRRKATGAAAEVRHARRKAVGPQTWMQPIRTMAFTVLDCERAGLEPGREEILSIGAVKIRENRVVMSERFWEIFKPTESLSPEEIVLIRGLGADKVGRGMALSAALDELLAFIGDSVVVGHQTELDLECLNAALGRSGKALRNPVLDTRLLYQWWRRTASPAGRAPDDRKLEELALEMKLPRYPAHHAYYDALTTGLLFLKLLAAFEASGAVQFRALYREAGVR